MSSTFNPSPSEIALVNQIFVQSDPQKVGILTGDVAVRVFGGAKLPPTVLGEIWSIADEDNNGWLSKKGVMIAVRLMGWAQKGEKVSEAIVNKPGPLPTIEGVVAPVVQHNTGISLSKSPPPGLPPLTAQDRTKFLQYFTSSGAVNGLLTGERARDIFVKSKLPLEKLKQIWSLADTQNRGALDSTDFAIGMYLIQASMHGQLLSIPQTLPPGLYEQAAGIVAHTTGGSIPRSPHVASAFPPAPPARPIQQNYTGQSSQSAVPKLPARPSAFGTSSQPSRALQWDVTADEKLASDRFFDSLDPQKKGFIEGDVAVPFMLESKLDGEILAQVWDLADINNDGRLTRDGFAVAMHLIQGKLAGKDVPSVLPPTLVPPSMRSAASQANGSPFVAPVPPEPQRDLLWDDSPPTSATLPQPTAASGAALNIFAPPPSSPSRSAPRQDPFGSSSFGGAVASSSFSNIIDDDDTGTSSPPLHDKSAEIGNVQNQLNSTNRSLNTTKSERAALEQTLANQAAQLSALQTQLSSAKAAYETETKLLSTLRERYTGQMAEIQKTKEQLIHAESDLSAIRVEKSEVEGAFLRDKEEARDLHRKMVEAGTQVENTKAAVEKAKKDAKQQKGLLAIARKQLSTKEAEKAKAVAELEEANRELTEATTERVQVEAEVVKDDLPPSNNGTSGAERSDSLDVLFAAAHTLPVSPDPSIASGTTSPGNKSNNPFFNTTSTPRSSSPFVPFANNSLPTSPEPVNGHPAPAQDGPRDPFGFAEALEPEHTKSPSLDSEAGGEGSTSTPKPSNVDITGPSGVHEGPLSPESSFAESEDFTTPPTTAISPSQSHSPDGQKQDLAPQFPDVEAATSHFPALDNMPNVPGHFGLDETSEGHGDVDLRSQVKEVEADEESSDDSDDEDEQPLAVLAAKSARSQSTPVKDVSPASNGSPPVVPALSFNDIFGSPVNPPSSLPTSETITPSNNIFSEPSAPDLFSTPDVAAGFTAEPTTGAELTAPKMPVAGVSEFDEAMGIIPSSTPITAAPQVMFDSAFEDNFDFSTASAPADTKPTSAPAPAFPPVPTGVNGKSPSRKSSAFDSIFSAPGLPSGSNGAPSIPSAQGQVPSEAFTQPAAQPPTTQETTVSPEVTQGISFDEAFSGIGGSQALHLDSAFGSPTLNTSEIPQRTEESKPFPTASPVTKNRPSSPLMSSMRSASPPHAYSPKGRTSTSSSKDSHEKPKESVRHSKLSIRLPFGKKKKQEPTPPPQSSYQQFLSPVQEPVGEATPALDDDVDSVKQLCSMGFSRTQSVIALEKYGYDMPKALNSLLGQQ